MTVDFSSEIMEARRKIFNINLLILKKFFNKRKVSTVNSVSEQTIPQE